MVVRFTLVGCLLSAQFVLLIGDLLAFRIACVRDGCHLIVFDFNNDCLDLLCFICYYYFDYLCICVFVYLLLVCLGLLFVYLLALWFYLLI